MSILIHLSVPAGTYRTITQALQEANAIKKFIQYHYKISKYIYNIKIYVSNIKPSKAEYICIPNGKGRPARILSTTNIDEAYVEPHLHIAIEAYKGAETISNAITKYLMKHHESAKNNNYRLHVYKKYILKNKDAFRKYVKKQAKYIVTIKPLINKNNDDFYNDFYFNIAKISCLQDIANDMVLYNLIYQMGEFKKYIYKILKLYIYKRNDIQFMPVIWNCLDYIIRQVNKYQIHVLNLHEKLLWIKEQQRYFYGET